ncbi:hypothetical protein [Duganella vulcania]|uniref:RiboL-PSP-HEPN domain-containing protein n=1 Tax=Duganella vulcania TaxID=2692166 RepID=A0A845GFK4_9BURK|nr:hypothetical protein [Duganella vulcania]MYM92280.1 hypothetical protein [Duganella vulcania]
MSYDEHDAVTDEFYEQIRQQVIEEFTVERLQSFYHKQPDVMRPAVNTIKEAKALLAAQRFAPALVFSASAFELLLKSTLLRPVVYGLVHNDALAEILVNKVLGRQTDIDRFKDLLAGLFKTLAHVDLDSICRPGSAQPLMKEAKAFQTKRDRILHAGAVCTSEEAESAYAIALAIYEQIVTPMIGALHLSIGDSGTIGLAVFTNRRT